MSFELIELLIQISAIAFFAWLYFALSKVDKQLKDQDSGYYKQAMEKSPRAFRLAKKLMPLNRGIMLFMLVGNVVMLASKLGKLFFA